MSRPVKHFSSRPLASDAAPESARRAAPRIQRPAPVFSRPDPAEGVLLEKLPDFLREIFPLSGTDKRHLPYNVAALSEILTSRRGQLAERSYWTLPALAGAYLWYFLPWNLIRLMGLLPGLKLELAPGAKILDLGSGPLVLPLALWLSRPDLRDLPLHFTCLDSMALPLRLGCALFRALAGADSPWRFTTVDEPLFRALPGQERDFSLLTACNMLNELKPERHSTLAAHLGRQVEDLARRLKPGGQMLIVEPGNRLGGKIIAVTRAATLQRGFTAMAPCPHQETCPLSVPARSAEAQGHPPGRGQAAASWCHFTCAKKDALVPVWLDELSREAHLGKDKLTLSWLFLKRGDGQARHRSKVTGAGIKPAVSGGPAALPGRVVSNPLLLPGRPGRFFYVCSARGLVLLQSARNLRSGEGVEVLFTGKEEMDLKSGAIIVGMKA